MESIDILKIEPSKQFFAFILAFVGGGLFFSLIGLTNIFMGDYNPVFFGFLIFGLIFSFISIKVLSKQYTILCIDRRNGVLSFAYPRIFLFLNKNELGSFAVSDIHALQIVGENVQSNDSDRISTNYKSFELNAILKNLHRINLMDYNDIEDIRKNGVKVAEFLNVPIWDAA